MKVNNKLDHSVYSPWLFFSQWKIFLETMTTVASGVRDRVREMGIGRKRRWKGRKGRYVFRSGNRPVKSLELNYRILSQRPWEPAPISGRYVVAEHRSLAWLGPARGEKNPCCSFCWLICLLEQLDNIANIFCQNISYYCCIYLRIEYQLLILFCIFLSGSKLIKIFYLQCVCKMWEERCIMMCIF